MDTDGQKSSCEVIWENNPYWRWIGFSVLFVFIMFLSVRILNHHLLWLLVMIGVMGAFLLYFIIIQQVNGNKEHVEIDFLREQLARGDITHEQFVRMKEEVLNRQKDYILIRQ